MPSSTVPSKHRAGRGARAGDRRPDQSDYADSGIVERAGGPSEPTTIFPAERVVPMWGPPMDIVGIAAEGPKLRMPDGSLFSKGGYRSTQPTGLAHGVFDELASRNAFW